MIERVLQGMGGRAGSATDQQEYFSSARDRLKFHVLTRATDMIDDLWCVPCNNVIV